MSIQAVVFDVGGVLLCTESEEGRSKWELRLGLAKGALSTAVFESDVGLRAKIGLVPEAYLWQYVATLFRLSPKEIRELEHDFWSGLRLDPVVVQFVHNLRPHYKTAILSNAWSGARDAYTNVFGLGNVVDTMIISAEEGISKPDTRIYQLTAKRLGVSPNETVFVDDIVENVQGARIAGMNAVHFITSNQAIDDIQHFLAGNRKP